MRSSPLILLLAACTPEGAPLTDATHWEVVEAADDPFEDRPDSVDCPTSAWAVEVGRKPNVEVDTGTCAYFTATQPSLSEVMAGQPLQAHVAWSDLTASEPSEAHVAVRIGDVLVLDRWVEIPADRDEVFEVLEAPTALEAGTPVWVHLHNHGDNSWNFYDLLSLGPEEP